MERDAKVLEVREFMSGSPAALRASQPIDAALAELDRHGWKGAPVVDDAGHLVGVLSEVDAVRVLASAAFHAMPPGVVADHMSRNIVSVSPETDVYAAAQTMLARRVRRLLVCEGGKAVGLVSLADLGRALLQTQAARDLGHAGHKPEGAAWDPRESEKRDHRK